MTEEEAMSNLPVLAQIDTEVVERAADPAQFVIASCERAKAWLAELLADNAIEQIIEVKSQAEAIRVYTMQKGLGKDAELSAQEIVRRAERGIGVAIRRGQEAGEIAKRGTVGGLPGEGMRGGSQAGRVRGHDLVSPTEFLPQGELSDGPYPLTDDVSDEQFEEAVEEAKAEGNLSRANVVRKVAGEPKARPAPEPPPPRRKKDQAKTLGEAVTDLCIYLDGVASRPGFGDLDESITPELAKKWATTLTKSMTPLLRFRKKLNERSNHQ